MALEKSTEIRKIEAVGQYRAVQVATDTVVKEDGKELSRSRHRHVLYPHMDVSGEDAEVLAVCNALWTDSIKTEWDKVKDTFPTPGA